MGLSQKSLIGITKFFCLGSYESLERLDGKTREDPFFKAQSGRKTMWQHNQNEKAKVNTICFRNFTIGWNLFWKSILFFNYILPILSRDIYEAFILSSYENRRNIS